MELGQLVAAAIAALSILQAVTALRLLIAPDDVNASGFGPLRSGTDFEQGLFDVACRLWPHRF